MTPTPAQIEAAAGALQEKFLGPVQAKSAAIAALTAAAEVGEQGIEYWKRIAMKAEEDANAMARDARVKEMSDSPRWDAALVALERNHTIERCAQVAVDWRGWLPGNREPKPEEIAAAIRALKDTGADPNLIYPGKDADFVFPEE